MRRFSAHETHWLQQLDGIELAPFWRRALAFGIDVLLILAALISIFLCGTLEYARILQSEGHKVGNVHFSLDFGRIDIDSDDPSLTHHMNERAASLITEIAVPVLYFGMLTWLGKGRSPGKWILRIRVVSVVHPHLSFWHSIERALGYGAATLEGGFGFVQFFLHPYRRCAQDRLAETIVVTERGWCGVASRIQHVAVDPDARPAAGAAGKLVSRDDTDRASTKRD